METTDAAQVQVKCANCQTEVPDGDRFCGGCGRDLNLTETVPSQDVFELLGPTLLYYFVTLLLLGVAKFTMTFPEGFEGMAMLTGIDVFIVLVFTVYFWKDLSPLFDVRQLQLKTMGIVLTLSLVAALIVSVVADVINISILEDVYYSPYLFEDTNSPLLWIVVFTCLVPALFEEIAFRGFMLTNIKAVTSPIGAIYVTSFVFGIIHLSFISLLWLVPIGIVFAWLRLRYNTLWYGIIAHFAYNFFISLIDLNILSNGVH